MKHSVDVMRAYLKKHQNQALACTWRPKQPGKKQLTTRRSFASQRRT